MKSKVIFAAATTLVACSMAFASAPSVLPGSRVNADQTEAASVVDPAIKLPGAVGKLETPTVGISTNGMRPGAGVESGLEGSASMNSTLLPGVDTTAQD